MRKYLAVWLSMTATLSWAAPSDLITQSDILGGVRSHELVQQALINASMRGKTLAIETAWKGLQFSLLPAASFDDAAQEMALAEAAIGAELAIPLALSQAERERRIQAQEAYILADAELAEAYGKAYAELFSLYADAYLAQEAIAVSEKEAELALLKLESTRQKVFRGLSSVSEQTDADTEYQAAAEKVIQSQFDLRLAWFNLAYAARIDTLQPYLSQTSVTDRQPVPVREQLVIPVFQTPGWTDLLRNVPQTGILMVQGKARSVQVQAQERNLDAARRALEDLRRWDLNFSPKIQYVTPDLSASLGYGTASTSFNLGTTWKPFRSDSPSGGSQPPDNSVTLSIGVSGNLNPAGDAEKERLGAVVQLEERKLRVMEQGVELAVRSRYAAYLKARDSLAEAERAHSQALELSALTRARSALGQTSAEDETADEVLLIRSAFNIAKAESGLVRSYLGLIASANAWDIAGFPINFQ